MLINWKTQCNENVGASQIDMVLTLFFFFNLTERDRDHKEAEAERDEAPR